MYIFIIVILYIKALFYQTTNIVSIYVDFVIH